MRILLLGGTGMLGHKVFQVLRTAFPDTWCTVRRTKSDGPLARLPLFQDAQVIDRVDALVPGTVTAVLDELRPDVVVNCIGAIKQREEARDALASITLNAALPHVVARRLAQWNGRFIHVSTDCVFRGTRGPYTEDDIPDAVDLYGRTKVLGEVTGNGAITIRTSIIGRELMHHQSLLEWFLAQAGRAIRGYRQVWWSGVTTVYLARVIQRLIADFPALTGLYHVSGERITKYDLLVRLKEGYALNVEIAPDDTEVSDRSLDGARFARATGLACPSWDQLIPELVGDPTPYNEWTI